MKKINSFLSAGLLLISGIFVQFQADAAIKLPALIGNNMVLQQNATIKVWGWADAGEEVAVQASWQSFSASAISTADGNWQTTIQTPAAGGPYKITITGRDYSITLENIMIGEVWVCSGQSNMQFTIRGLGGWSIYKPEIRDDIAKGQYADVRLFTVQRDSSAVPLASCKGNWKLADTNTVNDFSATAWFYGSYLSKELGVPVGLISSAWGGTSAEAWTPVESIAAETDLGYYLSAPNRNQWGPGTPGVLFNAMINPLLNYTIKGAIWYQGETNVPDYRLYPTLISTMISSWRKAWNVGEFPFFFVQIAPFTYEKPFTGALLREAQLKCLAIPNTGMTVILDVAGDVTDIHPKNKLDVGKRLALLALKNTYGKSEISFSGPNYSDMKLTGNKLVLEFKHTDGGLKFSGSAKNNFTIAGDDHIFYPATVKVKGNTLIVSSSKVKQPQAARYAFTNTSEATLFNGTGLPASSFRTDTWDIITEKVILKPILNPDTKILTYQLSSLARESDIYYNYNKLPNKKSPLYSSPIPSGRAGTLFARLSRNGYLAEITNSWKIVSNKAVGAGISYEEKYSSEFTAGGNQALLDGITATTNYQDRNWQGFAGNDLDVVIDLGKTIQVKSIKANFLSDNKSRIFLPKKVTVQVSEDGITYKSFESANFSIEKEIIETVIHPVSFTINNKIRFIKVTALNQGSCSVWHPGSGNKPWLFVDEIVVD